MRIFLALLFLTISFSAAQAVDCSSFTKNIDYSIKPNQVNDFVVETKNFMKKAVEKKVPEFKTVLDYSTLNAEVIDKISLPDADNLRILDHSIYAAFQNYCHVSQPNEEFNKFINKEVAKKALKKEQVSYIAMMHFTVGTYFEAQFKKSEPCPAELKQLVQSYLKQCDK